MSERRMMQFHENPAVIAWWMACFDKALVWFTPDKRRTALVSASIFVGVKLSLEYLNKNKAFDLVNEGFSALLMVFATFGVLWLIYRAAIRFSHLPTIVRRHPQITLHTIFWACLALLWNTTSHAGEWRPVLLGLAFIFPFLLWRCGYMLMAAQHGRIANTRFRDHLFYLLPAFGGSNTPHGKGFEYLSRSEAKTEEELARSQLAGIKLFVLYGCWIIVLKVMEGILYGPGNALTSALGGVTVGIPRLDGLIAQGARAPVLVSWASIYCELVRQVLRHAINGHAIIGILRLFGFNVFRNTYKPLLAESVVEFWNRYYYYFKELLVNFFFLPTFTQLGRLKKWPHLRLFAAVFAAAFIGNMYYHMLQHETALLQGNVFGILYELRSRAFYCLLLAIGIFISMMRQQRRNTEKVPDCRKRILRIFGVWTFFSLIYIWNIRGGMPFFTRVDFFLNLFGLA